MDSSKYIRFINRVINKNKNIVTSTKIDSTIKAIINNFISTNNNNSNLIYINYLNIIRIIYYLSRVKYYKYSLFKQSISKITLIFRL